MSAEDSSTPAPAEASEEDQRRARAWFRHLRTERGRSRNTLDNYSRDIDRYLHWLASRSLDMTSVSTGDVEDFIMDLRKGHPVTGGAPLAQSTVARILSAVRGLHRRVAGVARRGVLDHGLLPEQGAQARGELGEALGGAGVGEGAGEAGHRAGLQVAGRWSWPRVRPRAP